MDDGNHHHVYPAIVAINGDQSLDNQLHSNYLFYVLRVWEYNGWTLIAYGPRYKAGLEQHDEQGINRAH